MSGQLKRFFEVLINTTKNKADSEIKKSINLIEKYNTQNIGQVCQSVDSPYRDITEDAKSKLEEGINLKTKGNYFNYKDAIYKSYTSQKMVVDSLIQYLSDQESYIKSEHKQQKLKPEKVQSGKGKRAEYGAQTIFWAIFLIAFDIFVENTTWSGRSFMVGDDITTAISSTGINIMWSDGSFKAGIGLLFGLLLLLILIIAQKMEGNIDNKIKFIDRDFNKKLELLNEDMSMAKLEKEKLNIDKEAEKFSPIEYERYLLKNYG